MGNISRHSNSQARLNSSATASAENRQTVLNVATVISLCSTAGSFGSVLPSAASIALVAATAGNAILARTYQGLRDRQLTILAAQFTHGGDRIERAVANHERLIEILRSGTVDELVAETHTHVRSGLVALGVDR